MSLDHELEQFEDDPLEFIRQDLALPSFGTGDAPTRRQAAADVVRALVASGFEAEATQVSLALSKKSEVLTFIACRIE
jgi:exportin-2 (importin alpha re-exporter)